MLPMGGKKNDSTATQAISSLSHCSRWATAIKEFPKKKKKKKQLTSTRQTVNNCSTATFLGRENPTVLHPPQKVEADMNQLLWLAGAPRSRTCVQPFRNRALSPPQPRTRAWMPSFVTWSHQEIFSCSSSGHPSLGRRKEKRVAACCFTRTSCFEAELGTPQFWDPHEH